MKSLLLRLNKKCGLDESSPYKKEGGFDKSNPYNLFNRIKEEVKDEKNANSVLELAYIHLSSSLFRSERISFHHWRRLSTRKHDEKICRTCR
jgi:hypothetical protein